MIGYTSIADLLLIVGVPKAGPDSWASWQPGICASLFISILAQLSSEEINIKSGYGWIVPSQDLQFRNVISL